VNADPIIVKEIKTGETMLLSTGAVVKLAGIKSPMEPDLAEKAKNLLIQLSLGKTVTIEEAGKDRHGYIFVQVYITDKNGKQFWLQSELIKSGRYFVYPMEEAKDYVKDLLKQERSAQTSKRGVWAENGYSDISAEKAEDSYGKYSFVVGIVADAAHRTDKPYLNFGSDWHTDFTISISDKLQGRLKKSGIDLASIKGKKVRARGLIEQQNGPMIIIYQAEQLELLP